MQRNVMRYTQPNSFFAVLNLSRYIKEPVQKGKQRKAFLNRKEIEVIQISPVTSYWENGEAFHLCEACFKPSCDT